MNKPNGLLAFALMSAVSLSAGAQELKLSYNATDTINATTLKDLSGNGYDGTLVGTGVSISKKYSEQSVFISTSRLKKDTSISAKTSAKWLPAWTSTQSPCVHTFLHRTWI